MVKRLELELESWANSQREAGARIVLANGAFDMLHVGHLRYLQAARSEGDIMLVAINSDSSVQKAKGPARPIVPEMERQELVETRASILRCSLPIQQSGHHSSHQATFHENRLPRKVFPKRSWFALLGGSSDCR